MRSCTDAYRSEGAGRDQGQWHAGWNSPHDGGLDVGVGFHDRRPRRRDGVPGTCWSACLSCVRLPVARGATLLTSRQGEKFALRLKFGDRYPIESPEVSTDFSGVPRRRVAIEHLSRSNRDSSAVHGHLGSTECWPARSTRLGRPVNASGHICREFPVQAAHAPAHLHERPRVR